MPRTPREVLAAEMIRAGNPDDLPSIVELLVRSNETPYAIERVAEEKVLGQGLRGAPTVSVWEEGGAILGVAVNCDQFLRLLAVDPAHRRRGIGTALMPSDARVAFDEPGNYFTPGVIETDLATQQFLTARGFVESGKTVNLVAKSLPAEIPAGVERVTESEAESVLAFIESAFGTAWRFEAARALLNDPVTLFIIRKEGEIVGFSAHEANNRGLGTFGPTGVVHRHRRRGLGAKLLAASLADLRRRGFAEAIIPWTDATGFYRHRSEAEVAASFVQYRRLTA